MSFDVGDAAISVALAGIVCAYALRVSGLVHPPEEDAAMLLRYAGNVAEGRGIVWNPGEPPVDGATDFLFLLAVGGMARSGMAVEVAAKAVGLAAHLLTVVLVFLGVRRLHGEGRGLALVSALYLGLGPGLRYVAASYGTTVFALAVACVWWRATRLVQAPRGQTGGPAMTFGLACLGMGLARPEGALLAVFCLAGVLLARAGADARAILARFALTFGALGLAYFLWRWSYFGHPLPNPFYRRGGGVLHVEVLARAARNVVRLGGPFLFVVAAGLLWARTRRTAAVVLLPIALFTVLWVLFSDEANYYMRYRYPVLPILLLGWPPVMRGLLEARDGRTRLPGWTEGAMAAAAVAGVALWQHHRFRDIEPQRIGLYDVARRLSAFRSKNYALATTEAGLLPLYSRWRSVDAWGLNDAWIAGHGGVTEEYLDRYRPEVVMFHAYFSPETADRASEGRGLGPAWNRMVRTLQTYAERRGYELAAVFAKDPWESHYYYVRPGFLDHDAVRAAVHAPEYDWDGRKAMDLTPRPAVAP